MASAVQTITATILIQVGAGQPQQLGTIQIPIEVSVGGNQQLTVLHNAVPGARPYRGDPNDEPPVRDAEKLSSNVPGYRGITDDDWMTAEQVRARFPINEGAL